MNGSHLIAAIERIAPLTLAEPWDNVGLLAGDPDRPLDGPVLLTIDLSDEVMNEAERLRASAIIAYHPPIFRPIQRLTTLDARQRLVHRAIRAGMLIYSPHSALDAAEDGLTDWLARSVGQGDTRALVPGTTGEERDKIVTFVPASHLDQVRSALAASGAGRIGAYERCSFAAPGRGTFFGTTGTNPAAGAAGTFESVEEMRLEMICPRRATALAIEALRGLHPYEEPAIDVYPLQPLLERGAGSGRRVVLDRPTTLDRACDVVKAHLQIERLKYAVPRGESPRPVKTVGFCAGSGAELLDAAASNGCDLFVTGEMTHHEIIRALDMDMAVILAGHTNTERGYLPRFAQRLTAEAEGLRFVVSAEDRTPVRWV
ncbi:MAG: Nif3-like dinuclear metal center hexameric protein [Phycisphaerales bacterium]